MSPRLSPIPRRRSLAALTAGLLLGAAGAAAAQDYPRQPIKVLVPSVPGSAPDAFARILAEPLSSGLGQKVVVENKPGAGGLIAMETLAKAEPNGYTLAIAHDGNMAINTIVYKQLPYRPLQDFTPVSLLGFNEFVLAANPALKIKTFAEFVAYARGKQGKATYGSAGVGSPNHLFMEQLMQAASIPLSHVPYKGGPAAMQDLLGGQIDVMLVGLSPALPHIQGGKLVAVAVPQAARSKMLPGTPTVAETIPGFATRTWFGLYGPAGLPAAVVERLNRELRRVLADPSVKDRIAAQGMVAEAGSAATLAAMTEEDIRRYRQLADTIKLEAN
ncbi:MAG: tripartite tricarboxylate transporter substrate binding protein [Alcaligenaceae bacterium]|nr:tripartite tricarboxylate transporter substrate binding protein [Alcaligenaceae bacterium SAGV5]MPS50921.1 tripartite tricarboxylate transporter substrate binding protein [Alcaligenaceae bacterium SAGV3]MPT59529.1 tripartite tricarboxylate transporter substrate binding protein [Alcaligenaceae bacterium]